MKTAIYPGSFDPVTYGHIDIINRAAKLFDKLIVLVSVNPMKPTDFPTEERVDFIKRCISLENVEVDSHIGLFIDYFRKKNADVIVKGLRAMSDFEYEFQMALINKDLCPAAETVFLSANAASMFLSSSAVKQIAMFGGDVSAFLPCTIAGDVKQKLEKKRANIGGDES
jgi:pantetheine-phosphate adenylyltransferase